MLLMEQWSKDAIAAVMVITGMQVEEKEVGKGRVVGFEVDERLRLPVPVEGDMVAILQLPSKLVELAGRCLSRCA